MAKKKNIAAAPKAAAVEVEKEEKVVAEAPKAEEVKASEAPKAEEVKVPEAPKAEVKAEAKKEAAPKKAPAKKAAAPKKETVKKEAAPKAAKKDEKPVKVVLQFAGKEFEPDAVVEMCKNAYRAANPKKQIRSIEVYVKPEESKAYYVINGKADGLSIDL